MLHCYHTLEKKNDELMDKLEASIAYAQSIESESDE
jgi:hypothetical protein